MSAVKIGDIRQFHNGTADPARIIYPNGLVRVIDVPPIDDGMVKVEYLTEVSPLNIPFWADQHELEPAPLSTPRAEDLWVITVPGIPTFYLNGSIQGIVSKLDAAKIAASIIGEQASVGASNIERLIDVIS